MLSYGTLHEGALKCTSFLCPKEKKKKKKKKQTKKQKNIYVQNGRSKTRVAYEKGEAKERVREKMQKID